jgi:chaperonin GroES
LRLCAGRAAKAEAKDFPWAGASNMKWPLLTIAAMQFNARMYPAVVKGDEAVLCKVIGQDNGKPAMAPNPVSGEIQPVPAMTQQRAVR